MLHEKSALGVPHTKKIMPVVPAIASVMSSSCSSVVGAYVSKSGLYTHLCYCTNVVLNNVAC